MSDLISKTIALEQIKLLPVQLDAKTVQRCIEAVSNLPTVDAVPIRHGYWITEEGVPGVAVCSNCGHEIRGIGCQYTKYCEECGARMVKE